MRGARSSAAPGRGEPLSRVRRRPFCSGVERRMGAPGVETGVVGAGGGVGEAGGGMAVGAGFRTVGIVALGIEGSRSAGWARVTVVQNRTRSVDATYAALWVMVRVLLVGLMSGRGVGI